jgi:hypothetical protein
MKIFGLCFFLVIFFLAPISQAQESSVAKNTQTTVESSAAAADGIVLDLNSTEALGSDHSCAYMRTYRVKRDRPASDMTRPAGYTICVPFKRFEMKSAVQVQDEPRVRK